VRRFVYMSSCVYGVATGNDVTEESPLIRKQPIECKTLVERDVLTMADDISFPRLCGMPQLLVLSEDALRHCFEQSGRVSLDD